MSARVFVAPHAMQRFRERVCRRRLTDDDIIAIVQHGIANAHSHKARRLADGTPSITYRVRGQEWQGMVFEYRAVVVPPDVPGGWPVVGTILHGSSGLSRGVGEPRRTESVPR